MTQAPTQPAFILILSSFLLCACQSVSPQQLRAGDEQRCLSRGFIRGTEGFATCLQREDHARQADSNADHRAMQASLAYEFDHPTGDAQRLDAKPRLTEAR